MAFEIRNYDDYICPTCDPGDSRGGVVFTEYLTDSEGSREMAIDASLGQVEFYYEPPGFQAFYLSHVSILAYNGLSFDFDEFGNIPSLSIGCTLYIGQSPVFRFKSNADIYHWLTRKEVIQATPPEKSILGHHDFKMTAINRPVILQNSRISLYVNDNISAAGFSMSMTVSGLLRNN